MQSRRRRGPSARTLTRARSVRCGAVARSSNARPQRPRKRAARTVARHDGPHCGTRSRQTGRCAAFRCGRAGALWVAGVLQLQCANVQVTARAACVRPRGCMQRAPCDVCVQAYLASAEAQDRRDEVKMLRKSEKELLVEIAQALALARHGTGPAWHWHGPAWHGTGPA